MKIAVIDIETTGFLNDGGRIVEVGIVELDLETGETNLLYDELVKENGFDERYKDAWIFSNSDLKFEDVMNAKPMERDKIQFLLNSYPVTAYNKAFDLDFLRSRGFKIEREMPCPMIIATPICNIPGPYGPKWPKVQEAWDMFFPDSEYKEEHRGADDAMHEAKIIHYLYERGHYKIK